MTGEHCALLLEAGVYQYDCGRTFTVLAAEIAHMAQAFEAELPIEADGHHIAEQWQSSPMRVVGWIEGLHVRGGSQLWAEVAPAPSWRDGLRVAAAWQQSNKAIRTPLCSRLVGAFQTPDPMPERVRWIQ